MHIRISWRNKTQKCVCAHGEPQNAAIASRQIDPIESDNSDPTWLPLAKESRMMSFWPVSRDTDIEKAIGKG